jgi:hypothetical protein
MFPRLFQCCDNPFATVAGVREANGWRIRFRRTFGLAETVEWENLCRIFDLHPYSAGDDEVKWSLEASGDFSTRSIYGRLTQGAVVTHFKEVWKTRVPPRIKIFLWQLIRSRLPSGVQVAKRNGPTNGACALCGEQEDCDHIFFSCHLAKLMWAGARELLHCDWNPAGAGHFIGIVQNLSGSLRRLAWFTFAAQCWALWNIRNKLAMEGKTINNPADAFFHMITYMQRWRVLVRPRDREMLDVLMGELRGLQTRLRAGA